MRRRALCRGRSRKVEDGVEDGVVGHSAADSEFWTFVSAKAEAAATTMTRERDPSPCSGSDE